MFDEYKWLYFNWARCYKDAELREQNVPVHHSGSRSIYIMYTFNSVKAFVGQSTV